MPDLERYFKRHHIDIEDILYIYRLGRKTVICCESAEDASSAIPMHELLAFLPEEKFLSISRSAIVRRDRILNISHDGVYTMADGKTFQGRTRYLSTHRRLRKEMHLDTAPQRADFGPSLSFLEKCSILDDMPIAYCVIELVFDDNGHGVDFIFRYCNKHMAVVEGIPVEEMLNRSFYDVFKNGDRKWVVSYADVALNGSQHTLRDYSPEIGKTLTIYCYQPQPGYCACVLIPDQDT